ncbi:SRPBCC family protein [Paenarthrobacter sp. NPDC090517]|uniref:SRPBCC family protein n=1 Tax=Paenarthrobacter sp. NPDC090517 TaxID=3364381 RepID=UPI0037F63F35
MFLWLCQLRRAPYSYDWIDNFGKRSPRVADRSFADLALDQEFMTIFTVVGFAEEEYIALKITAGWPSRVFGDIALVYAVEDTGNGDTFVHVEMWVPLVGRFLPRLRRYLLAWGDLLMMRKQLRVISDLASREA